MGKKKNPLENVPRFLIERTLSSTASESTIGRIGDELEALPSYGTFHSGRKKALRCLLANLVYANRVDPSGFCRISLDQNRYRTNSRYNSMRIGYQPLMANIKGLEALGFIEKRPGFQDRTTGKSFETRIRATEKLTDLLNADSRAAALNVDLQHRIETIVLKDADKKRVEYDDTAQSRRRRMQIADYQGVLDKYQISVDLEGYDKTVRIDLDTTEIYRVFNKASFDLGGRFYGGWWQNAPKDIRPRVLIDGRKTLEVDYSGIHVVLAYAVAGLDFFEVHGESDPYLLPSLGTVDRRIAKKAFNIALNTDGRSAAINALTNYMEKKKLSLPNGVTASQILDETESRHQEIKDLFYTNVGRRLQNIDSIVTEEIVDSVAVKNNLAVLLVHDSYIVEGNPLCGRVLIEAMTSALANQVEHLTGKRPKDVKTDWLFGQSPSQSPNQDDDRRFQDERMEYLSERMRKPLKSLESAEKERLGVVGVKADIDKNND